jgi:hypothetical protein
MVVRKRAVALAAGLALMAVGIAQPANADTRLCNSQTASVAGGAYVVQNDEWNSSASECISTTGGTDFRVVNSSMNSPTGEPPAGYPSIFKGCHWGTCTPNSGFPIQVSGLDAGKVTTSWNTSQPAGGNVYDVAYDVWYNQSSSTTGQPNGTEVMVWLAHNGNVGPAGNKVATVTLGGVSYDVWFARQSGWNLVSYARTSPATSVSNLDLHDLTADSVSRGYIQNSWWMIDVEAGFELWKGGTGLATNSFSVTVS